MITVGFLSRHALYQAIAIYGERVRYSHAERGETVAGWLTMEYLTYVDCLERFSGSIL